MAKSEIEGIQYLRGIAAFAVVVDHTVGMAHLDKYFGPAATHGFFSHGARGVDLFFLISGFIICMISFQNNELAPALTGRTFFQRRFVRIIPMMWLAIIAYGGLRLLGRGTFPYDAYLRALFLFPLGEVQPVHIWTLRHEVIFYTLFAMAFLLGHRRAWIIVVWAFSPFIYAWFSLPAHPNSIYGELLRIIAHPVNIEFFTGFMVGVLWHKRSKAYSFSVPVSPMIMMCCAMIAFMIISFVLQLTFDNVASTTISSLICAVILFFGVHVRCHSTPIDRLGQLLGDASYAVYLFHPHIISATLGVWATQAHQTPVSIVIVCTIFISTVAGVLIHLAIEKPLIRALRKSSDRQAKPYDKSIPQLSA